MEREGWIVEVGYPLVEEADERAHDSALRLALFAEEEQIVPSQQSDKDEQSLPL